VSHTFSPQKQLATSPKNS
jgi:hypothetical protein